MDKLSSARFFKFPWPSHLFRALRCITMRYNGDQGPNFLLSMLHISTETVLFAFLYCALCTFPFPKNIY